MNLNKRYIPFCRLLLLIIINFLFLINCTQPTQTNNIFWGITRTNEIGEIISEDSDDWKHDTNWLYNDIYLSYKDSLSTPSPPDSLPDHLIPINFQFKPAYPNPSSTEFTMKIAFPTFSEVFVAVINQSNDIIKLLLLRHQVPGILFIQFNLMDDEGNSLSSGIYRCIYRFEDKMTGEFGVYHGHGDLKVE